MNETSKRVIYLHDLQDAGYDSDIIREFSKKYTTPRKTNNFL
jgi:hypothetical protein